MAGLPQVGHCMFLKPRPPQVSHPAIGLTSEEQIDSSYRWYPFGMSEVDALSVRKKTDLGGPKVIGNCEVFKASGEHLHVRPVVPCFA